MEFAAEDDRVNSPLGTLIIARADPHPAIVSIQNKEPCVVVGYNAVRPVPLADETELRLANSNHNDLVRETNVTWVNPSPYPAVAVQILADLTVPASGVAPSALVLWRA